MEHLVETALLTHGLRSITNADLAAQWRCPAARLAWVDRGRLQIGDLSAFLPLSTRAAEVCRIDCNQLEAALTHGVSGADCQRDDGCLRKSWGSARLSPAVWAGSAPCG